MDVDFKDYYDTLKENLENIQENMINSLIMDPISLNF